MDQLATHWDCSVGVVIVNGCIVFFYLVTQVPYASSILKEQHLLLVMASQDLSYYSVQSYSSLPMYAWVMNVPSFDVTPRAHLIEPKKRGQDTAPTPRIRRLRSRRRVVAPPNRNQILDALCVDIKEPDGASRLQVLQIHDIDLADAIRARARRIPRTVEKDPEAHAIERKGLRVWAEHTDRPRHVALADIALAALEGGIVPGSIGSPGIRDLGNRLPVWRFDLHQRGHDVLCVVQSVAVQGMVLAASADKPRSRGSFNKHASSRADGSGIRAVEIVVSGPEPGVLNVS